MNNGYSGYANDKMNHIDPGRGDFHKEIVICDTRNIEFVKKEEISKELEQSKRDAHLLQKIGNPIKKKKSRRSYFDDASSSTSSSHFTNDMGSSSSLFNSPPSSPMSGKLAFGGKRKTRKSKRKTRKSKRKTRSKRQRGGTTQEEKDRPLLEVINGELSLEAYGFIDEDESINKIKQALNNGADVNVQNNDGDTALMWASEEIYMMETSYLRIPIVALLLKKGADVNVKDHYGNTALLIASLKGHTKIVEMLLEKKYGADR